MNIYISIVVFTFFLAILTRDMNKYNIIFIILSIFLLFVFSGFKSVGSSPDDLNYYYSLYYSHENFEYLYTTLERTNIFLFNGNMNIQFMIISFISLFALSLVLYKNNKLAMWSLLIYMCHIFIYRDMIQIRAAVSYNFSLLFFVLINENKNKIKCAIPYVISIGFHISSIFSIFATFLRNYKLSFKKYIFLLVASLIINFIEIRNLILSISDFLPSVFLGYLNTYVNDTSGFAYEKGLFDPTLIKNLFFSLFFLYHYKKINSFFGSNLYINIYCLSCIILISLNEFAVLSSRLSSLFSSVEILLVPAAIYLQKRNKLLLFFIFTLIYSLIISLNLLNKDMLNNYQLDIL